MFLNFPPTAVCVSSPPFLQLPRRWPSRQVPAQQLRPWSRRCTLSEARAPGQGRTVTAVPVQVRAVRTEETCSSVGAPWAAQGGAGQGRAVRGGRSRGPTRDPPGTRQGPTHAHATQPPAQPSSLLARRGEARRGESWYR